MMNSDLYTQVKGAIYRQHINGEITLDECDRRMVQLADHYYGKDRKARENQMEIAFSIGRRNN